jgi:ABC-2 type transport system permease protein
VKIVRYLRLLGVQMRGSLLLALQYRADFVLDGMVGVFWTATALVPLWVVFRERTRVAGWSFGEALMVAGWFTLLEGVLEGAINPSLLSVVEAIRKGTLDLILVKPADAQFLVSTARFQPWRAIHLLAAVVIFRWGFHELGRSPGPVAMAMAAAALAVAISVLYSLWIVTVSAAFYVVRVDNLTYLFGAIFDAARWPVSVFRGVVRFVFTFIVPLALMTTFPARALLGTLSATNLAASVLGAALALTLSRAVWKASIAKYTSAGG